MDIIIRDSAIEARIQRQLETTGSGSVEELLAPYSRRKSNKTSGFPKIGELNDAKIRRGIEQLDRGEVIPENELDSYLAKLRALPEPEPDRD